MKKIFLFVFLVILGLLAVIAFNTLTYKSQQESRDRKSRVFETDTAAVHRLSAAIRIRTISFDADSLTDYSQFDTLIHFLKESYPETFSRLEVRTINSHSLLLHWKGLAGNKKPVILYAHLDVVPAGEGNNQTWTHAPFAGVSDENFIYGRGAIDDKGSVIALLESVERLLRAGYTPSRDVYLAFGHDEEASGEKGARNIAAALQQDKVQAEFLLDEGGLVAVGMVPFVSPPVAIVFTSEKGYLTLELRVTSAGGHSGIPPRDPPVEILARAIRSVHEHPFERRMTPSVESFMDYTGPEMNFPFNALFANRWLFNTIIFREYEKIPSANAMIRTTAVTTVIQGGDKENVIPATVTAKINFRLLPGDSISAVVKRVKEVINNDRVEISIAGKTSEPSPVSSTGAEGFRLLQKTIAKIFPDAVVAPSLLIAQTDSRHFRAVTENIYRFQPVRMDDAILKTMHGLNEKIGIKDFMEMIAFYEEMLRSI